MTDDRPERYPDIGAPRPPDMSGPPPFVPPQPGTSTSGYDDDHRAPTPPPPGVTPVPPLPAAGGGILQQIGDIGITNDTVITPNGNAPLRGAVWIVSDQTRTEEKIPAYAIVLAILFFLACLLGLLFLLIKERKTTGYVEVRVQSDRLLHMTQIPVSDPEQVARIRSAVGHAQMLSQR